MTSFEIAGGSVPGSAHVVAGRNNQDAFCWARAGEDLVAVVCDGCSGASHSDLGAKLGARLFVQSVARLFGAPLSPQEVVERARLDLVARLRDLAGAMSLEARGEGRPGEVTRARATIADHFLFTIVGVLAHAGRLTTFALGDGVVAINGDLRALGPFPNNEPPYLGYALLEAEGPARAFELGPTLPSGDVETILIGSDGVVDLDALAERALGASGERVGPLRQFWEDDQYSRNTDAVRRRLTVIGRGAVRGLLPDDTTLVVLRRAAALGGAS